MYTNTEHIFFDMAMGKNTIYQNIHFDIYIKYHIELYKLLLIYTLIYISICCIYYLYIIQIISYHYYIYDIYMYMYIYICYIHYHRPSDHGETRLKP